jgi:prevent-host-death family protein
MTVQASQQFTIGATEARNNFGDLLKRVYGGKEHLIVEKGGIPVAALVGIREYEEFQRWRVQEEARSLGRSLANKAGQVGMDEAQLAASLADDRKAIHREQYGS